MSIEYLHKSSTRQKVKRVQAEWIAFSYLALASSNFPSLKSLLPWK